uniref:Uncharacterized protein n=1 Tax=Salarias fasciatus TaxID=181472 RepID=A0A672H398_SALFA
MSGIFRQDGEDGSRSCGSLVGFGRSVPKQGLLLLHWFANIIDFKYDAICLTFDPNNDFGSHHYGNYDDLLPTNRYRYYTVGNIHKDTQQPLPDHIINPRTSDLGGNSARIIFSVRVQNVGRQSRQVIDEVYLTQHHGYEGSDYDGRHMYRITANLLRQIRTLALSLQLYFVKELQIGFISCPMWCFILLKYFPHFNTLI